MRRAPLNKENGMMKLLIPTVLVLVLGATACTRQEQQLDEDEMHEAVEEAEHAPLDEQKAYSDSGEYLVTFLSTPDPIPLNEIYSLTVTVRDSEGLALDEDYGVLIDGFMPAHGHGMNTEPEVTALGEGRYLAENMRFHMPGEWVVYVDVVTGETVDRTTFDVLLEE